MASELRRRVLNPDTASDSSPPASSREDSPVRPGDKVKVVHHIEKAKTQKRKSTLIFLIGSLCGLIAAGFLAQSNDLIAFPEFGELSMDSFLDVLPAGFSKEMKDLMVCSPTMLRNFRGRIGLTCCDSRTANVVTPKATMPFPSVSRRRPPVSMPTTR